MSSVARRNGTTDHVQALARALSLMNRIAEVPDEGVSLTDLALQVGLPTSTAHRLLTTLEQERYVRFDHEARLWSIGVQAFIAGCAFAKSKNIGSLARPHMRRLMLETEETVNLAVQEDEEVVYLSQVECSQIMRAFARPGMRVPIHCSAVGKAIASGMPERALSRILHRRGLPRLTVKTITTPKALLLDLNGVRKAGFAVDDEEHAVGLRCVAAPIYDEAGDVVAAVSVSGPAVRIGDDRLVQLGVQVRATAGTIAAEMGGTRNRATPCSEEDLPSNSRDTE